MSTSPAPQHENMEDETGIDRSLDDIMDSGSRANEVCRDFQRGYCPRGDRCWFKHVPSENQSQDADLSAPGIVASLGGRALCRDYIRGHCRRGVECPFFHVKGGERCRDFERLQDCRRGIFCPFLHVSVQSRTTGSPGSPGLLPIKPNFGFERESESVYDRSLPPQYFPRRQFDPYARVPKPVTEMKPAVIKTELCRDWARFNGDCPRGASCQYLHGNPGDICRDFSRRGRCYRGDNCPFSHQVAPEVKPEVCMKFLKGECTRGQSCLYSHSASHRPERGQDVCRKFLRGECTRGSTCNYYHPPMNAGPDEGHHEYSGNDFN